MSLPLPPKSIIRGGSASAQLVHEQFTSVIAGHPQATTTYRFYEEVDEWLGPWGTSGYPIGYGKYYNIAFTTNEKLMANPVTRQWVWQTGIRLQEGLLEYIVERVRNGTIGAVTESELREAAFNSHPAAYDRGGLSRVVLAAPELLAVVGTIPLAEFNPFGDNFSPTVKQVFVTLGRISPEVVGGGLAGLAGPAHTGIFRIAIERDRRRFMDEIAIGVDLAQIERTIESGHMDNLEWLDRVIRRLNMTEFPDQGFARAARHVIEAAERRKLYVQSYYRSVQMQAPGPASIRVQRRVSSAP